MPSLNPSNSPRVVVVDDDRRVCRLLTDYLKINGFHCDWLDDGRGLLTWLALNPHCDAIVLDLDMPQVGGLNLLATVRAGYPHLPVLMCTGAGFDEDLMRLTREAGATGYVSKGLPVTDTLAALRRVVALGRAAAV